MSLIGAVMAAIFVSYSRADRPFVDDFVPLLRQVFSDHEIWFDEHISGGEDWWNRILSEINDCDLFIYLLSNDSLASEYCQAEFREALRLQKPCLPVIARSKTDVTIAPDDLAAEIKRREWIDMSGGFRDYQASARLYAAVNNLLSHRPQSAPAPLTGEQISKPDVPLEPDRSGGISNRMRLVIFAIIIVLVAAAGSVILNKLSTTSAADLINEAKVSIEEGNPEAALEAYMRAVEIEPDNTEPHLALASFYSTHDDFQAALDEYTTVVELSPEDPRPYVMLTEIYLSLGDHDQAMETAEQLIALRPDDASGYMSRSHVYREMNELQKALEDADHAVQLENDNANARINRALTYRQLGQIDRAQADAQQAIKLDGENPDAYFALAEVHLAQGEPQAALDAYTRAIDLNPQNHFLYQVRAEVNEGLGRLEDAIRDYQRVLELGGENPDVQVRIDALQTQLGGLPLKTVEVPANADWIDTGIVLHMGQQFHLEARGNINIWMNCEEQKFDAGMPDLNCAETTVGPFGGLGIAAEFVGPDAGHPLPDAPIGALLWRIGEGETFVFERPGTFTAESEGPLLFGINDDNFQDNEGAFIVEVELR
jgi:tetratricopeptide (TPR) repeat protein